MTAHDPRVTLTEAESSDLWEAVERNLLDTSMYAKDSERQIEHAVERIIAARLAPIRALAAEWLDDGARSCRGCDSCDGTKRRVHYLHAEALRKALDAPQDASRGSVSGEQGAEACWSCDGTGSLLGGQHDGEACPACTEEGKR